MTNSVVGAATIGWRRAEASGFRPDSMENEMRKRRNPAHSPGAQRPPADALPPSATGPGSDDVDSLDQDALLLEAIRREAVRQLQRPRISGLCLVATPIGNLGDMSLRGVAAIARSDIVLCEDTRHSRALLAHYGLRARLDAYHEHNGAEMRPRVLAWLAEGKSIVLISDAGMPLISDPGFKLVRDVLAAGHNVRCIPGPCAALAALVTAGLPTDTFHYAGFLPPRSRARGARITELAGIQATLIFYEAPQRTAETLADLAAILGPRPAVIARELTKLNEGGQRGTLSDLALMSAKQELKGEIVIVVGPPEAAEVGDEIVRERLAIALAGSSLRDAARTVARELQIAKGRAYALGVELAGASARQTATEDDEPC